MSLRRILSRQRRVVNNRTAAIAAFACAVAIAGIVWASHFIERHENQHRPKSRRFAVPCIVLTQNASLLHKTAEMCTVFSAPTFSETEFQQLSSVAQNKILHPELLVSASELSNNASVNIYMNHVRMWAMALTKDWENTLLLEDDAVLLPDAESKILQLLDVIRQQNITNYILKLVDHWNTWQWTSLPGIASHELRTCSCRPAIHSSSSAAYIIDKEAAHTLLKHAFPATLHVDSHMHDIACSKRHMTLLQTYPHLATYSYRPSQHMPKTSPQRAFLLIKEMIINTLNSNC